jgi:phenylacetate-CoA ligase
MNDRWLQLYHRLPAAARSAAATLRGYHLRAARYSNETESLVAAAFERENWPREHWQQWQEGRLALVLERAAARVPYYRARWAKRQPASWTRLADWPILEKEVLRGRAREFVADDCDVERMYREHTSGTSGNALDLWLTRATLRAWYALNEARWRRWYNVQPDDHWALLGGRLIKPVAERQPPFWVWNRALKQLYLSAFHLAPDLIPHYLDALARHRVTSLLGYASALYALAQGALTLKRTLPMKVAITNAEPLYDYQRAVIAEAFQCPVRETYGMAEYVTAAGECEAGSMHLWPEVGWVEVVDGDKPVAAGTTGDLLCTGLLNIDMPLIRYRLGDRAALLPEDAPPCACGRTLPRLARIEGRIDDVLYTVDGRRLAQLNAIFKTQLPVREAQLVQERLDRVRVRYVPAPEFNDAAAREIARRLQARMGKVEVVFEEMTEIPRTANGKFRVSLCQLPPEQIRALRAQNALLSD